MNELERLEKNVEDAKAAAYSYGYDDDDAAWDAADAAWEARRDLSNYLKEQDNAE